MAVVPARAQQLDATADHWPHLTRAAAAMYGFCTRYYALPRRDLVGAVRGRPAQQ
jgi:hypothetical protein